MEEQRARIDPQVFLVAAGVSVAFVLVGVLWTDDLATVVADVLGWIVDNFGWFFVLSTAAILVFVGFLALTRFGRMCGPRLCRSCPIALLKISCC